MEVIACNLNMFDEKHGIYLFNTETKDTTYLGFSNFEELPKIICQLCQDKEIYDVHLFGASTYAKLIAEDIIKYNELNYSENKELIVEVN